MNLYVVTIFLFFIKLPMKYNILNSKIALKN